ncbi:hypothetical protein D3C80_1684340 [compost metagenome]
MSFSGRNNIPGLGGIFRASAVARCTATCLPPGLLSYTVLLLLVTNSDDYGTLYRKRYVCLSLAACPGLLWFVVGAGGVVDQILPGDPACSAEHFLHNRRGSGAHPAFADRYGAGRWSAGHGDVLRL